MGSKSRITTTSLNNFKPLRQTLCWNRNRPGINFSHSSSWGRMKSSDWWNKNNFTWAFQIPLQSFYWRTHLGKDHHSDHMPSALCFSLSHFSPSSSSIQAPVTKICIFMYIALSRPKSVSWRSSALLSGFRRQKWTPRQRTQYYLLEWQRKNSNLQQSWDCIPAWLLQQVCLVLSFQDSDSCK